MQIILFIIVAYFLILLAPYIFTAALTVIYLPFALLGWVVKTLENPVKILISSIRGWIGM